MIDIKDAASKLENLIDASPDEPVLLMDGESLVAIAVSLEFAEKQDEKIAQLEKELSYWVSVADIRQDSYEICMSRLNMAKEQIAKLTVKLGFPDEEKPTLADEVLPLNTFNLSTEDGRLAFLWSLYHDHQDHGLLAAVSHTWSSLGSPKTARCNKMAAMLGLPGTGKIALKNVIQAYLQEALYDFDFPDLPEQSDFGSFDEWNDACLKHFDTVQQSFGKILAKYEAILDGRQPQPEPVSARIIKGPWGRKPFRQEKR